MDFTVSTGYRSILDRSEKRNKYLSLMNELKTLWSMKMTGVLIITGELAKWLEQMKIQGRKKIFCMTALLKSVSTLKKVIGIFKKVAITFSSM